MSDTRKLCLTSTRIALAHLREFSMIRRATDEKYRAAVDPVCSNSRFFRNSLFCLKLPNLGQIAKTSQKERSLSNHGAACCPCPHRPHTAKFVTSPPHVSISAAVPEEARPSTKPYQPEQQVLSVLKAAVNQRAGAVALFLMAGDSGYRCSNSAARRAALRVRPDSRRQATAWPRA